MGCGCAKISRAEVNDIEDLNANQISSRNLAGLDFRNSRQGKKNPFMKEYQTESIIVESTTRRGERFHEPDIIKNDVVMFEHSALFDMPRELSYEVLVWNPNKSILQRFQLQPT